MSRSAERRNERLKRKMDLRSQARAESNLPEGVELVKKAQAFSPETQRILQQEQNRFSPQMMESALNITMTGEFDPQHADWLKAEEFSRKVVSRRLVESKLNKLAIKAAKKAAKEATTTSSNPVEAAEKAVQIAENAGIKIDLNKFWGTVFDALDKMFGGYSAEKMRPASTALICSILLISFATSCVAAPEIPTETEPAATLVVEDETEEATSEIIPTEEGEINEDPGDTDVEATKEALLSISQLEAEIDQAAQAANIEITDSSSFAEELYKLDYISPATDKTFLFNNQTNRAYVRLNEESPYGPAGTLITPGVDGGILFISGESKNIIEIKIDSNNIAYGEDPTGREWAVDAETGTWVLKEDATAEQVVNGEVAELSAEEIVAYDNVINYYFPELISQSAEIYKEIRTAEALIDGSIEYDQEWNNEKRANIALAVNIVKEKQRGAQPVFFIKDGVTYYYDKDRGADNPWSSDPSAKEKATIGAYIAMYRNKENNNIVFYWEGKWQEAPRSNEFDYGEFITKDNVNDYVDPNTVHETFARQLNDFNVSFVPMIILDNNRDELEKHPMYRQGRTYLDDRIDVLLPNPNNLYGINGKMLSMDTQVIFLPNAKIFWKFNNKDGEINEYFDDAFVENQTTFIGLDEHQRKLDSDVNTNEYIENISITDDIVDGTIWQDIDDSSLLSIYQWNSIDLTRTVVNNQFVDYP